jgi:ribosome-associated toxin RatA of RatAB toxin-antitoxin module
MRRSLPLLFFFVLLGTTAQAGENARLDAGEILVSTQNVADSDVPRVTVKGVINATPERVWAIVSDCARYPGRMPRITAAREIERSGNTVVCEVTVGLPFPLSDLTSRTRATHTEGPPRWRRAWTMIEGDWDYKINDGSWTITEFQGDENRALAVYVVHAEPHTRVPQRMQRRAQESSMPGVIEALRDLLE